MLRTKSSVTQNLTMRNSSLTDHDFTRELANSEDKAQQELCVSDSSLSLDAVSDHQMCIADDELLSEHKDALEWPERQRLAYEMAEQEHHQLNLLLDAYFRRESSLAPKPQQLQLELNVAVETYPAQVPHRCHSRPLSEESNSVVLPRPTVGFSKFCPKSRYQSKKRIWLDLMQVEVKLPTVAQRRRLREQKRVSKLELLFAKTLKI